MFKNKQKIFNCSDDDSEKDEFGFGKVGVASISTSPPSAVSVGPSVSFKKPSAHLTVSDVEEAISIVPNTHPNPNPTPSVRFFENNKVDRFVNLNTNPLAAVSSGSLVSISSNPIVSKPKTGLKLNFQMKNMKILRISFSNLILDVFDKISTSLEHCFLFLKPNGENPKIVALLEQVLADQDIQICMRYSISGKDIAARRVIERQYLELFKYAEVVKPAKINLSLREKEAFKAKFNVDWRMLCVRKEDTPKVGQVMNAKDAMEYLGVDKYGLDGLCRRSDVISMRIKKGLYCAKIDKSCTRNSRLQAKLEQPLYVLNSFYAALRDKFSAPDACTTCLLLEWHGDRMPWKVITIIKMINII